MDYKIGHLLEQHLIGDIIPIIFEYNKKCLWEYAAEFPYKGIPNKTDCFDDYLTIKIPVIGNRLCRFPQPAIGTHFRSFQCPVINIPAHEKFGTTRKRNHCVSVDGKTWSETKYDFIPTNPSGHFVFIAESGLNHSIFWLAGILGNKEPPKTIQKQRTLIPRAFKWELNSEQNNEIRIYLQGMENIDKILNKLDELDKEADKSGTLLLGFEDNCDISIPVKQSDHTKIYNYLKQYFDFL